MNSMTRFGLALVVAMAGVTCAPTGLETVGDAMMDAGERMSDAAPTMRDATIDAVDDTGRRLSDTGAMIRDSAGGDAAAQCATCTAEGAAHTIAADSDPRQSLGGSRADLTSGRGTEVAMGPLVLTDFAVMPRAVGGATGTGIAVAFTVPDSEFCDDAHAFVVTSSPTNMRLIAGATFSYTGSAYGIQDVHGARIHVPSGSRLCIEAQFGSSQTVTWAAFRPYE